MTNEKATTKQSVRSNKNIRIKVFGVGGAGGNAVNNMIASHVKSAQFYVANTDAQDLEASNADHKILLGKKLTHGLGAGAKFQVGQKAAEESRNEISRALNNTDMAVITAGMGGGTGTGAAPVIAKIAHSKGILTIAVVTKPFTLEGRSRSENARKGLMALKPKKNVDTLICISNNRLLKVINPRTPLPKAFKVADNVLRDAVVAVTSLITQQSYINLDFADVTTVMKNQGSGLIGIGTASGKDRAIVATRRAIKSPLLTANINSAKQVLLNVEGGANMSLLEAQDASKTISDNTANDVNIIFGTSINKSLGNSMRVTVIATGIKDNKLDKIPDFDKRKALTNSAKKVSHPHYSRVEKFEGNDDTKDDANVNGDDSRQPMHNFEVHRTNSKGQTEPRRNVHADSAKPRQHRMPPYFRKRTATTDTDTNDTDVDDEESRNFAKRAKARLSRRFKNTPFFNKTNR